MSAQAPTSPEPSPERLWWLRALATLQAPAAVFAALRNDSDEQAYARQEPVLALTLLAGISGILLTRAAGRLLDEPLVDDSLVVVAVLVFLLGAVYGAATYWIGGAALYLGLRGAGSSGSYRRARHLLAFAVTPLVLGLVLVWPVRLALYGADTFRSGGEDAGAGRVVLDVVSGAFAAWALGLLVYGITIVERWSAVRACVALGLVFLGLALVSFPFVIPLSSR
jgi:Yip1 domain